MRLFVGMLLIAASLVKALDLYLQPTAVLEDSFSRFLMPMLVGSEMGLGLSALLGISWHRLRSLIIILFSGFTGYSLLLAVQGVTSCGCFGPLDISPWWVLLLDFFVLAGLFLESHSKKKYQKFFRQFYQYAS